MDFSAIRQYLEEGIGLHPESIGTDSVDHTIASLLTRSGCGSEDVYLELLHASAKERERLVEALVVHETWFFRDREPYVFLRKHVRGEWLPDHPGTVLRILSAPCSTGEEPWSIAISLLEEGLAPKMFRVEAVDISAKGLEKARRAVYDRNSFRENGGPSEAWFVFEGRSFRLLERAKESVHFSRGNLLDPAFATGRGPYHIIFCRNLVVYLSPEARKRVFANLDRMLVPGGILITGSAEVPFFQSSGYEPERHARSFACRKTGRIYRPPINGELKTEKPAKVGKAAPRHPRMKGTSPAHCAPVSPPVRTKEDVAGILAEVRTLADQNRLEEALALCGKAISEGLADAEVYYLSGLIHFTLNRLDEAENYFLKAVYLDPSHYEALVSLSLIYQQRGDASRMILFRNRARKLHASGE